MDATRRPLQVPPKFATYAEKHGIFEMYKRLLEQLIVNKPADPLSFIIDLLQRDNDNVPHVVILGPPASGKCTISRMICKQLRTAHVTPDNLVEEADGKLKQGIKECKEKNQVIPTELWMKLLIERMKLFDCVKKGWVMSGFPETREQAQAMQVLGITAKHCVVLEAPDTVLIERAAGKRIDPKTKEIYHTTFDWPSASDIEERLQVVPGNTEADIIERLVLHHRHIDGLNTAYKPVMKTINADQPRMDVYSQVISFLASQSRSAAPHTPRIVLLGATGSGKATQASLLANKYNIVNVSCGKLVKQAIAQETKTGAACKPYVEKNMLVPDPIIMNVLKQRLGQLDCVSRGWVLHGYPRTREQAEQLDYAGFTPNRVYFLDVPSDSVAERLTLRATDPVSGTHYHLLYNPPLTQEVKERLQVHPKDVEDAVRHRMSQWNAYCEELEDMYVDAQRVNADQDPHTVFECIESMLVNQLPKQFPAN